LLLSITNQSFPVVAVPIDPNATSAI